MWPRSISQQPLIADGKLLFPFFFPFKCLQHGQAFNQTHRASLLCGCSSEDNMNVLQVKIGSSLGQKSFSDVPVLYLYEKKIIALIQEKKSHVYRWMNENVVEKHYPHVSSTVSVFQVCKGNISSTSCLFKGDRGEANYTKKQIWWDVLTEGVSFSSDLSLSPCSKNSLVTNSATWNKMMMIFWQLFSSLNCYVLLVFNIQDNLDKFMPHPRSESTII